MFIMCISVQMWFFLYRSLSLLLYDLTLSPSLVHHTWSLSLAGIFQAYINFIYRFFVWNCCCRIFLLSLRYILSFAMFSLGFYFVISTSTLLLPSSYSLFFLCCSFSVFVPARYPLFGFESFCPVRMPLTIFAQCNMRYGVENAEQ